jgi:hypothetical protein
MKEGFLLNNLTIRKLQITAPTNRLLTKPPSNRTETALFVLSRFISALDRTKSALHVLSGLISALDRTKSALLVLSTCKRRLFPSAHLHQSVCLPTTSDAPRALDPQIARRASPPVSLCVQKPPFPPAERYQAAQLSPALHPLPLQAQRSCSYPRSRGGGRPLSRASRTPATGR